MLQLGGIRLHFSRIDVPCFGGIMAAENPSPRLRLAHIDYCLMHMFTDFAEWERLQKLGIEPWIARQKAAGQIRYVGKA